MEIKNPIFEDLEFGQIYHLFTRVSGNEKIFRNDENFRFFLEKLSKYLLPYFDIYAYCLVSQRFSLLVCFHSRNMILKNLNIEEKDFDKQQEHKFLMQPISNLLNSYAKAYNKIYQRKGALFVDYIKRERIDDEDGLKNILRQIHQIPIQNKLVNDISDWKFSSYNSYLEMEKPSKVNRKFMFNFFEDKNDFIEFHKKILTNKTL